MHSRVEKVWIDPSYWLLFVEVPLSSTVLADVEVKNVLEDQLATESCDKDAMSSCQPLPDVKAQNGQSNENFGQQKFFIVAFKRMICVGTT